jgi:hypothetical protein
MATVYGANLGPAQACWGTADPGRRETPNPQRPNQTDVETKVFPAKLCDAEVQVGGIAAGLVYVSAGQINFKVPQTVLTKGDTTVVATYKDQAGPAVSIPLTTDAPPAPAEQIAAAMWSDLQRVKWEQRYERGCTAVPAQQGLRGGLYGHAYYCKQASGPAIAESFYYPVDPANPKLLLLRADIRPAFTYSELSAEVEQFLIRRLTKAYGAPVAPDNFTEIGAYRPDPGLSWHTGKLTIFVHRNRNAVAPAGVRLGVILIAVRDELLEQRRAAQSLLVTGAENHKLRSPRRSGLRQRNKHSPTCCGCCANRPANPHNGRKLLSPPTGSPSGSEHCWSCARPLSKGRPKFVPSLLP